MGPLAKIHQEIVDVLKEKFTLDRVQLKHLRYQCANMKSVNKWL